MTESGNQETGRFRNWDFGFRISRFGFTLIELLVVIAILAILAALLLPSLRAARQRGQQAVCMGNLRQIYLGFVNYAMDFDDRIPPVGSIYVGGTVFHIIGRAGYFGSKPEQFCGSLNLPNYCNTRWPILRCPGEPKSIWPTVQGKTYYDNELTGTSYGINWSVSMYCYSTWDAGVGACPNLDVFRRGMMRGPEDGKPAEAPFLMDCEDWGLGWTSPYFRGEIDTDSTWDTVGWYAFRHPGQMANVLFMDGHVQAVKHHLVTGVNVFKDLWSYSPP